MIVRYYAQYSCLPERKRRIFSTKAALPKIFFAAIAPKNDNSFVQFVSFAYYSSDKVKQSAV